MTLLLFTTLAILTERERIIGSAMSLSTKHGATTRQEDFHLLFFPHLHLGLLLLYFVHRLTEAHLLSSPHHLPFYPHHLLQQHGPVLQQVITHAFLQTLTSCLATPSVKIHMNANSEKNTKLLLNIAQILPIHTDCKHCVLYSLYIVYITLYNILLTFILLDLKSLRVAGVNLQILLY